MTKSIHSLTGRISLGLLLLVACARSTAALEADYRLYPEIEAQRTIVGPLIGHVTDTTASVWAYAGPRSTSLVLEVDEADAGTSRGKTKPFHARLEQKPDSDRHHRVVFQVEGLRPLTRYTLRLQLPGEDGAEAPAASAFGSFTTAPPAGKHASFRLAISSCAGGHYIRRDGRTRETAGYVNKSWQVLMDQHPDVQLIIGDNVYANSTDYNHLWDSHTLERANNLPFAEAISQIPTYGLWDDHDYGPNDSDGSAMGKERSLRAFGEIFANPPRTGSDAPGIFTRFNWGDVDFFLLDCRYHRSPDKAPQDDDKCILGDAQFDWLIDQLKQSRAPFKLLVNGSTWDASVGDGWRVFPESRKRLWKAIVDNDISGVVFVSGDIHRCDLPLHQPQVRRGYPMPEIISSGLGSHGKYDRHAFVVADFDTSQADPLLTARIIDGSGEETLVRRVRASQLQVRD